jgi:hypothetical protein
MVGAYTVEAWESYSTVSIVSISLATQNPIGPWPLDVWCEKRENGISFGLEQVEDVRHMSPRNPMGSDVRI